ncbi:hypothetical protein ADN00_17125 [Ornatilinea apprima]|uniref:Flagellar hook-associated protein 1 n=1 Tax=Ornatilinea apprima TaxID=1134406 RepID=A0A0P6WN30_9CHLR|nr:flagellar hook-associated protein FlgK [Ornatilinea apprima]KPL71414.1 hypothetical protein ADN00_17125 [Ornatilinea apprima]
MPNLFSGINMAFRAMMSHQQAIETIQHNVANVNTPGYHRQEVMLQASAPSSSSLGLERGLGAAQNGTGVEVDRIRRVTMEFFDIRYRAETSHQKRWELESEILQQVEFVMAETSTDGLLTKLNNFWAGWQALSADPSNLSLRTNLRDIAVTLTDAFNTRSVRLDSLQKDQDLTIRQRVDEINSLTAQLATLNGEITRVRSMGDQPNDYMDQRDVLLDRLAEIAGATAHYQDDGSVMVNVSGHSIVTGNTYNAIEYYPNAEGLMEIRWTADGTEFVPSDGELTGLFEARDVFIPQQKAGLDALATKLMERINEVHQQGYGSNGSHLVDFFEGTDAATFKISDEIRADLANIAASSVSGAAGDGENARLLFNVYQEEVMSGTTFNAYYNNQVTNFGIEVQRAKTNATDRKIVADAISNQRESVSGVSLDEEAANLVKSQRAYQAATRMMNVFDELLDIIINQMGQAGR